MTNPRFAAEVSRLRAEQVPEKEIARRLGITPKTLWSRTSAWNKKHPDQKILRAPSRPATPLYRQIAADVLAGVPEADLCAKYGMTRKQVQRKVYAARREGVLPPPDKTASDAFVSYLRYYHKGAAPPLGTVSGLLRQLRPETLGMLLSGCAGAATVADAIAYKLENDNDTR